METDWWTLVGSAFVYLLIFLIGIIGSKIAGRFISVSKHESNVIMVGHRSFGWFLSVCTISATYTGATAFVATPERAFIKGVIRGALFGLCFNSVTILLTGLFFAAKTRQQMKGVTFLEIYQNRYGNLFASLFCVPSFICELLAVSASLSILGHALSVMANINENISIITSAVIAISYTMFGGIFSVAYTDVIQLAFIFTGTIAAIPFVANHQAFQPVPTNSTSFWLGDWSESVDFVPVLKEVDLYLSLVLGGIPWQTLFQRIFACESEKTAKFSCLLSSLIAGILVLLPLTLGSMAKYSNWNLTDYGPLKETDARNLLPLTFKYFCPHWVTFLGLGAVSASAMSTADSCVLASASIFITNIYKAIIRKKASERELLWALRLTILIVGITGCLLALLHTPIYILTMISADIAYIVSFPQLVCLLYYPKTNTYGGLAGYFVAVFLRFAGGDETLKIPALFLYPGSFYNDDGGDGNLVMGFPVKTTAMICDLIVTIAVSKLTHFLYYQKNIITQQMDFAKCFQNDHNNKRNESEPVVLELQEQTTSLMPNEIEK